MEDTQNSETKEEQEFQIIYNLLLALPSMSTRYESLSQLYEHREFIYFPKLFWSTFGCVATLIHEIILVYPEITQNNITSATAKRMKYVFGILSVLSKEPETCVQIINNRLIYLIFPFFNCFKADPQVEYIQIAALGVMFDILTIEDDKLLSDTLNGELFSVLAKVIDSACRLGRTVALYTLLRIVSREIGILCLFRLPLQAKMILNSMSNLVKLIVKYPNANFYKIAKHLVRCYQLLYEYHKKTAYPIMKEIPIQLHNKFFEKVLCDDTNIINVYRTLCEEITSKGMSNFENLKLQSFMTSINGKTRAFI